MRGTIDIVSQLNKGTTFQIKLGAMAKLSKYSIGPSKGNRLNVPDSVNAIKRQGSEGDLVSNQISNGLNYRQPQLDNHAHSQSNFSGSN